MSAGYPVVGVDVVGFATSGVVEARLVVAFDPPVLRFLETWLTLGFQTKQTISMFSLSQVSL